MRYTQKRKNAIIDQIDNALENGETVKAKAIKDFHQIGETELMKWRQNRDLNWVLHSAKK